MMVTIWKSSSSSFLLSVNSQIFAHLRSGAIESCAGSMRTWLLHINWHGRFIRSLFSYAVCSFLLLLFRHCLCHIRYHFVHTHFRWVFYRCILSISSRRRRCHRLDQYNWTGCALSNQIRVTNTHSPALTLHTCENENVSSICVSDWDIICSLWLPLLPISHHPHHMIDILYGMKKGSKSRNESNENR